MCAHNTVMRWSRVLSSSAGGVQNIAQIFCGIKYVYVNTDAYGPPHHHLICLYTKNVHIAVIFCGG